LFLALLFRFLHIGYITYIKHAKYKLRICLILSALYAMHSMYEKMRYQLFIDTASFDLALSTNLALPNFLFQWVTLLLTLLNVQMFLWHFNN